MKFNCKAGEQLKNGTQFQVERNGMEWNGMEWCCELRNLWCILNSAGKSRQTVAAAARRARLVFLCFVAHF